MGGMRIPTGPRPGRPGQPFRAPSAHEPDALLPLVAEALSAGDVEAALGLYVPGAVLLPWHLPAASGVRLHDLFASLAALKVPVHFGARLTVAADGLAVLSGSWSMAGPAGLSADVLAIARREDSRVPVWQLVVERWTPRRPADQHFPPRLQRIPPHGPAA